MRTIQENVHNLLREISPAVKVVAAAKSCSAADICEAVRAGIRLIGHNYVQEAAATRPLVAGEVLWHYIGHLQRNKVKKAVALFDVIETVDSVSLAQQIDKEAGAAGKVMPVYIEVNSGAEPQKSGVFPEKVEELVRSICSYPHIQVVGLMTMGPAVDTGEDLRPYFRKTREIFDSIRSLSLPNVALQELSMGMSDSYLIAIEEGATIVRIGTKIFGSRSAR